MKPIISRLLSITPILVVLLVVAYIAEELVEDFIGEPMSDFVYPVAALVIFGVLWYTLVPVVQAYLKEDDTDVTKL